MREVNLFSLEKRELKKEIKLVPSANQRIAIKELKNRIRAFTLYQVYYFPFTWLEDSSLTLQGNRIANPPIQPISLLIFSPALTLCLLTLYYKRPLMGQASMHCASTECNPDTSSKVPFKASAIPERSMHCYFQPDCLPFRETLKWHFPRQIYRGGVHTPTNRIFPNIESWQYPCRSP